MMKSWKRILFFLTILYCSTVVYGVSSGSEKNIWQVSVIPDSLKINAHAVIRSYHMAYHVRSKSQQLIVVNKVVTVLDKKGDENATVRLNYDKFQTVKSLNIVLFDASGKEIRRVSSSEIKDYSAVPDGSFYADSRIKFFQPSMAAYPYTVEINYEISLNSLFFSPSWFPVDNLNLSVEKADFEVTHSRDISLRFKLYNLPHGTDSVVSGKSTVYSWGISGIKPFVDESFSTPYLEIIPSITVAPKDFTYGSTEGDMSSWKTFGDWLFKLNADKQELPEESQKRVREEIKGISDTLEIIRTLYSFMQTHTRYLSIQIGIGGWQPTPAEVVDRTGYGDCKGLSNYMIALLAIAGIEADYVLIKSGSNAAITDSNFPSRDFNHAIVCIPYKQDTIWLECTSQTQPFGFLGDFTDDRNALVVSRTGGKMVKTPLYNSNQNVIRRSSEVTIDRDGNGSAKIILEVSGIPSEHFMDLSQLNLTDQKSKLYAEFNIPDFEIKSHKIIPDKNGKPTTIVNLDLGLQRFATSGNSRIFLPMNIFSEFFGVPARSKQRINDVEIRRSVKVMDTLIFNIPAFMKVEYLPEGKTIHSLFGDYKSEVQLLEHQIVFIREFEYRKCRTGPADYNKLVSYLKEVSQADNVQAVLIK